MLSIEQGFELARKRVNGLLQPRVILLEVGYDCHTAVAQCDLDGSIHIPNQPSRPTNLSPGGYSSINTLVRKVDAEESASACRLPLFQSCGHGD